jgi:hypothetical protein
MVYKYKIVNKNINLEKLTEEMTAAGFSNFGFLLAGFNRLNDRVHQPNAAQKVIATSTGQPDDLADPGEIRFRTEEELTGQEETDLDAVYAAHDYTILTAEQTRIDVDLIDIDQLLVDFGNFDGMTQGQVNTTIKRALRVLVRQLKGRNAEI